MQQLKRLKEKYSYEKGEIYGRLRLTGKNSLQPMYGQLRRVVEAECECGNMGMYVFRSLTSGETKSCGCLQKETTKERFTTHGLSKHPLYEVWQAMRKRCYIDSSRDYPNYGGRGIEICDEWVDDFIAFYNWCITNGYKSGLSLDRKNNDKNYSPDNCHFTDKPTQNRNTRRNKMITAWGETKCLFDWGVDPRCKVSIWGLRNRLDRGKWADMEAMISTPAADDAKRKEGNRKGKMAVIITAFGESKCMTAWLEDSRCLVKLDAFRDRYKKGWDGERILTTPPSSSGFKGISWKEQVKNKVFSEELK